jgi:hypothetical protein
MGTGNTYWNAIQKAVLDISNVRASWGQGDYCLNKVALMNGAFDIYYSARTSINRCPDADQTSKMLAELEGSATDGWGSGVQDLDDAFEHMVSNSGVWTDEHVSDYHRGPESVWQGNRHFIQEGPAAGVNFLNSVNGKMAQLKSIFAKYEEQSGNLRQQYEHREWERAGDTLEEIEDYAGKAESLLWWAPTARDWAGRVSSFAGVAADMHTALTTYEQGLQAGFPSNTAATIVALQYAMKFVPVLGSFYGQLAGAIPGFAIWYRGLLDDYFRRIDIATRAR